MTDWAVAAHRGVPGSSGTGTVSCGLAGPLDGPVPEMSACRKRAPGDPADVRRLALALPSQSARAHRLEVSVFSRSRYRITAGYTCDKHSGHLSSIATRHVDNSGFLRMHRTRLALSQVKALPWAPPGGGIPSISTVNAQAKCRCAQVIHIFVHSQHVRSPLAVLAGSTWSARRCGAYVIRPAGRTRASRPGADQVPSSRYPTTIRRS